MTEGEREMDSVLRYEMSQQLIRKAIEMGGCCGLRAQVDGSTCLIAYPEHKEEWCPPCLMTAAGEMLLSSHVRDAMSRMLDMLERVEWVRAQGGKHSVCAFCGGVSERDGGPGHQEDCEWLMVTREGNELRMIGVVR